LVGTGLLAGAKLLELELFAESRASMRNCSLFAF
jgi:hypothetical protein